MVGLTPTRPGSCGHALPGYVAAVLREDGTVAPAGELGALTLTTPFPCLARTVWGDHDRYVKNYLAPFAGHYAASDGALFDADGQLWVTGRLDDVINVAGHRLGTMELEAALLTHKSVSEAAVVTQDDDVKGTVPVAFVVLRAGLRPGKDVEVSRCDSSHSFPARTSSRAAAPRPTRTGCPRCSPSPPGPA